MKKELIIIVYKIGVRHLSRQQADSHINEIVNTCSLSKDKELKDDYIIKEIFLTTDKANSDVKIIYPKPQYAFSSEINNLVEEITNKIKEDPNSQFKNQWDRLVRELN